MKSKNLAAIAVLLIMGACQKKDETPAQPSKVVTSITSPYQGQVVHKGDTVNIMAYISYVSMLHGYTLQIINKNNSQVVYSDEEHTHSDTFNISKQWIDTLTEPVPLELRITTELTHDGDTSLKQIVFSSQP